MAQERVERRLAAILAAPVHEDTRQAEAAVDQVVTDGNRPPLVSSCTGAADVYESTLPMSALGARLKKRTLAKMTFAYQRRRRLRLRSSTLLLKQQSTMTRSICGAAARKKTPRKISAAPQKERRRKTGAVPISECG